MSVKNPELVEKLERYILLWRIVQVTLNNPTTKIWVETSERDSALHLAKCDLFQLEIKKLPLNKSTIKV